MPALVRRVLLRFISIGDGIDTAESEDEFIGLRNWVNERYSRDISKKRRLSNMVKGNEGVPLSPPPYGYTKDPDNPKRWVIDEETAPIVRRIYRETMSGRGTEQIAATLQQEKILTPIAVPAEKHPGICEDIFRGTRRGD
jgi:DNA invertase Pin-like site-specific DNA recombinase